MGVLYRTAKDFIPIANSVTEETFMQRYDHPFLFGREVLEEEFRFQTLVTREQTAENAGEEPLRIRHWVIPIKKPSGVPGQDRIFLGRSETNDICVPHRTVSKLHAYFVRDGASWCVVDTGSANGTKVNGKRLPGREQVGLEEGDTIAIGRCVFQYMSARALYQRLCAMTPSSD
jgi:hypothetical protein